MVVGRGAPTVGAMGFAGEVTGVLLVLGEGFCWWEVVGVMLSRGDGVVLARVVGFVGGGRRAPMAGGDGAPLVGRYGVCRWGEGVIGVLLVGGHNVVLVMGRGCRWRLVMGFHWRWKWAPVAGVV